MRNVSQMLERLVDAADYCRSFGYWQGLKAYVRSTRDLSGHDHDQRATLTLPGIQWPFTVRAASSDLRVLRQVFIDKQYERPGAGSPGLIIDCGANIGLASIFFANAFVASPIYAIEPSNANFELLLENTRPYAQITPIHAAVWSSQCNLAITNPESEYSTFRTVPIAAGAVS